MCPCAYVLGGNATYLFSSSFNSILSGYFLYPNGYKQRTLLALPSKNFRGRIGFKYGLIEVKHNQDPIFLPLILTSHQYLGSTVGLEVAARHSFDYNLSGSSSVEESIARILKALEAFPFYHIGSDFVTC